MARKQLEPDDLANIAEDQLKNLQKAKRNKIDELMKKREGLINKNRIIQTIVYAVANTYREVFPGAEGFIELRIKAPDSIETKIRNDFTEILNELEIQSEANQEEIIKKINSRDIKDILALTVITTKPPEKFRTGDDELNKKLTGLADELKETNHRTRAHKRFIDSNEQEMKDLSNEISELRLRIANASSNEELEELMIGLEKSISESKDVKESAELLNKLKQLISQPSKEILSKELEEKTEQYRLLNEHVEYGEKNLDRTEDTYNKTLRELQYEMSSYFVSNLGRFSTFKYWGANRAEQPKLLQKPGFRAVKTVYNVTFSKDKSKSKIGFEAQGKGELDYYDAEFKALGAIYHEEQKTKDGIISKKTDMPDFTIIGQEQTRKIEREVRRKYMEVTSIEDLDSIANDDLIDELKKYEAKIREEVIRETGDNHLAKQKIKRRMNEAFETAKENLIQNKIEENIDKQINDFADSDFIKNKIQKNKELTEIYNAEKQKLETSNNKLGKAKIEHKARLKVMYRAKEQEILKYAKNAIPKFSRANIPSDSQEIVIYNFTVGESIYRYFYNKLNGLKDENGRYTFEPQEQQKRALLKLSGLFDLEDDYSNFYTYNRDTESFGGLSNSDNSDDGGR